MNRMLFVGLLLAFTLVGKLADAQVYYLDMNQQVLSVPNRTVFVEQVLDGRANRSAIGLAHRGIKNKPAAILFRQGLEPELTAWLGEHLPNRTGDQPIVLCLRQLRVGEEANRFTETAIADLAADVYVHQPDGYHFLRSVASHTSTTTLETTLLHAAHLASMFEDCLKQLTGQSFAAAAARPALGLGELAADHPRSTTKPVVPPTMVPRRGIYLNYAQFLENRPDTFALFRIDTMQMRELNWQGTIVLELKVHRADRQPVPQEEIWGFSDGRRAYVRHHGAYWPLTWQHGFHTFVGTVTPLATSAYSQFRRRPQSGYVMPIPGGFVPVPVMNPAQRNASNAQSNDIGGGPKVYALDVLTGQAGPLPVLQNSQPSDTAFVYVYRPLTGKAAARRIFLDDQEVGWLRPGEYLELPCTRYLRAIRLSIDEKDGPALLLSPSGAAANYVRLNYTFAATPWKYMPFREGEAEVDALERRHK